MRIIKSLKIVLIFIFLLIQAANAESVWTKYGWQIFNMAGDARSIALGNSFGSGGNSYGDALWNPALDFSQISNEVIYGHQSRFAGIIQSDLIALPWEIKKQPLGVILLHESIDHIPNTTNALTDWGLDGVPETGDFGEGNGIIDEGERIDADKIKYFHQSQSAIHISTSWNVKDWRFGVAVKTLFHKLGNNSSTGIGFDIGIIRPLWTGSQIGASIIDATTSWQVWDNGTVERFAPRISIGMQQAINFNELPLGFIVYTDLLLNTSGRSLSDDFHVGNFGGNFKIGMEFHYDNLIYTRFGRNQTGVFSTGIGLDLKKISLNYAAQFENSQFNFGKSHFISFSIDMDWLVALYHNWK